MTMNEQDGIAKGLSDRKARVRVKYRGLFVTGVAVNWIATVPGLTMGGSYFHPVPPLVMVKIKSGKLLFRLEDVEVVE